MKLKNIIELYDWDKEFDYEELAKLKENLQLLIHTGITEFLKNQLITPEQSNQTSYTWNEEISLLIEILEDGK